MKEEEAKKKLCPFNQSHQAIASVSMSVNTYCKGSDCMMWESYEFQLPKEAGHTEPKYKNKCEGDCGMKPQCFAQECRL